MKRLSAGLIGGLLYSGIYYLIAYIYLFVLAAPGDGFLASFLSIAFLGTVIEIIVAVVSTGISGMVALNVMGLFREDEGPACVIAGIIIMAAAICGFLFLTFSTDLTLWYRGIFGICMLIGGFKIVRL